MNFTLDIVQPKHFFCKKEYQANITSFLNDARDAVLALGGLNVQSSRTSKFPTGSHSPGQQAIYLPGKYLGEGGYGTVCLVTHLSTAKLYAAKELIKGSGLSKEAKLMRDISHKHIVQFVDFTHEPTTQLIMEYLPLGSLHDQHKKDPITLTETRKLLLQGLDALRYLHSLSSPITHRDIKPANILVQGRWANFHIKLSDFGLSKDTPFLKTGCGTPGYTPPEVYRVAKERKMEKDQRKLSTLIYDNKVDVWALGVVVLQYTDDLPYDALALYEQIADSVKDLRRRRLDDPLIVLLEKMLRKSPLTRPSSEDCFQEALKIGYPSDEDTSGSITPTRHDFEASNEMLASFKVPTQILAGNGRVLGSKRDPSPTRSSGHQIKRPRINHPYYRTVMGMLSGLRLHGALIDNGGNDEYTATSIELICDEFSRQKITHIKVDSVGSHGVTIKAYRANKSGEFVLGHFTSLKPTNSMDLAYELKIQNSEKGSNRASGLSEAASEYTPSAHYEHRLLNHSYGRLSSGTIKPPPRI
ncbi:serine/threonine protein kinase [[Emmonsia] crescens]|uniref:Serine/threonine protein kinase n=1 Tax=[Emmonsia] crescens TaxID=73230 RepID=A0A2B7ZTB4_9EURO|nr:serine/threonine protein kinase [Emmonsia crescens]